MRVPGGRAATALLVPVVVLAPVVLAAGLPTAAGTGPANSCVGRMASPANGLTVISVQGARLNQGNQKEPAKVVAVGPRGEIRWVHRNGRDLAADERNLGVIWSYDVDPLANGNLFVTATRIGRTLVYVVDPRTGELVWERELPFVDTHDADLLDEHRILLANMRNYNRSTGRNNDRILIYNRTSDEIAWEWRFREHGYRPAGGGNYSHDWTHVNDVDALGDGRYLVSVRNFDQTIVVNRSTGAIDLRVGADDDYGIMREQHNPQYLETDAGRPTVLVADSDNNRVVEYTRDPSGWTRTWAVGSEQVFAWPRDADRLPNGNTLIVDSANHRVLEVTPDGEVVWEFYSPWLVYDAERVAYGDEAGGPAIRDLDAEGSYRLSNGAPRSPSELEPCAAAIERFENPEPVAWSTRTRTATQAVTERPDATATTGAATRTGAGVTTASPSGLLAVVIAVIGGLSLAAVGIRRYSS